MIQKALEEGTEGKCEPKMKSISGNQKQHTEIRHHVQYDAGRAVRKSDAYKPPNEGEGNHSECYPIAKEYRSNRNKPIRSGKSGDSRRGRQRWGN